MGAAGDMLCGALLGLFEDPQSAVDKLNALGLPGVSLSLVKMEKRGITGWKFQVEINGQTEEKHDQNDHVVVHDHHTVARIGDIVSGCKGLSEAVKRDVLAVYDAIAAAESRVHGVPVEQVHFHEVGALDALADVTAFCWLLHELGPDKVTASPIHVGSGTVRCAHGVLPVPAPATAELLRGIPAYGGDIEGELCTPTGAALLAHFASDFGPLPVMRMEKTGYGMGQRDFPRANCVRAFWGTAEDEGDTVTALSCNLDDMTGEEIGFAMEALFDAGALEVYTVAAGMKKNRPGTVLHALCRREDAEKVTAAFFRHTTTIGVREETVRRHVLARKTSVVEKFGNPVRKKVSTGWGVTREKYEYEDLAAIARREGMSLREVREVLEKE